MMSSKHRETPAQDTAAPRDSALDEGKAAETSPQGEASQGCASEPSPKAAAQPGQDKREIDAEAKVAVLEAELSAVRDELSAVNDKYLRKLADDVNFRKRMAREKEEGQRYAVATLLGDLVPVLDDFDRAIASAETSKDYTVLHDGIQLIRRQIGQMLENKYGLVRFVAVGQPFDPNRHEAVAMVQAQPGEDCPEAVVAEEFLPGYGLHDRILRTAKVRVRMPAAKDPGGQGESAEGAGA